MNWRSYGAQLAHQNGQRGAANARLAPIRPLKGPDELARHSTPGIFGAAPSGVIGAQLARNWRAPAPCVGREEPTS